MKARIESYIRSQQDSTCFLYTTFIYVGFYYQNFQTFFQPNSDMVFRVPLETHARLPLYDVRDTGAVVAHCFAQPNQWGQGTIVPVVAQQLTMEEICQTIRRVTGRENVRYVPLAYEQCSEQAKESLDNMRWYNEYAHDDQRQAEKTRQVFDRMKTLEEWIQETRWMMMDNCS
jgi:nucleoside-diphosphate-sugar epimerase